MRLLLLLYICLIRRCQNWNLPLWACRCYQSISFSRKQQ